MDTAVKTSPEQSEKAKALAAALAQIEKQFGKGTIMRLGEGEAIEDIQVVSTGSLGLDIALGVGGLPRGRVIEIYGPESSGKTTLTLQVIAEMQKIVSIPKVQTEIMGGKMTISGDFSEKEIELALANNFIPVTLGNTRLRTETAAVVACHSVVFFNE